jgi:hypothetical protein
MVRVILHLSYVHVSSYTYRPTYTFQAALALYARARVGGLKQPRKICPAGTEFR